MMTGERGCDFSTISAMNVGHHHPQDSISTPPAGYLSAQRGMASEHAPRQDSDAFRRHEGLTAAMNGFFDASS